MTKKIISGTMAAAGTMLIVGFTTPASAAPSSCPDGPSMGQAFASHASVAACLGGDAVSDTAKSGHTRP
jgi:hypothetical protein